MSMRRLAAVVLLGSVVVAVGALRDMSAGHAKDQGAPEGADDRTTILLEEAERDFLLHEMRELLESVQGVVAGLAAGDMKQVQQAARAASGEVEEGEPASLHDKLPEAFEELEEETHRKFGQLARAAAAKGSRPEALLGQLSDILRNCTSCHATYRVELGP